MQQFNLDTHWKHLNCLLPIYDKDGGNSTEVWLIGGEKVIIQNKTNTVLKKLAKVFALDLSQLKRKYGSLVGRKSSTPLPFHPELILIPIKYREPIAKDEGSRGYVVKNQIYGCSPLGKTQTEINFLDNTNVRCLQSATSFNLAMAHAEIIARECTNNLHYVREREEIYRVVSAVLSSLEKQRTGF